MRLQVLLVLLAGAWARGATAEGPANKDSSTTQSLPDLEEIKPKSSLLEYDTVGLEKSVVLGETSRVNVSFITKGLEVTAKQFQEFYKDDEDNRVPSLSEGDNKVRLIPEEKKQHPEEKQEESLLDKGKAILAGKEELLTKGMGEKKFIYKDTLEEEEEEEENDDDDDEEEDMKPLSRKESLVKDEEMVKRKTQELELTKSLSDGVWKEEEKGNASNFFMEPEVYQDNETNVQANELEEDIVSILQLENEKLPKDKKYTMLVFAEKSDGAKLESLEEDDNTWFIFEEDESDEVYDEEDAVPEYEEEGEEEGDEDSWLTFEKDNYIPNPQRNSTVLTPEPSDGEHRFLEDLGDDVISDPNKSYGEPSDHSVDNRNGFDGSEDFSEHEVSDHENQNSPKEEYLSSHFYAYLAATAAVVIVLYAVYHNNKKIIAFVMGRRSGGGWRSDDANYQYLDNKV